MTKDEALALALDVLVEMSPSGATGSDIWQKQMSAITTIATALAQPPLPVQEPVAWMQADHEHISLWEDVYHTIPLYTAPPKREWVELAEEEIHNLDPLPHLMFDRHRIDFARAVEAASKEKNT